VRKIWPPPPPDIGDIVNAAEALGVSEYDFFRLAYRRWSGRDLGGEALERVFVAYMFHQTVPPWVRHFTRDVLAREAAGRLDAAEIGATRYRHRVPVARHGRLTVSLMAAATVLYCWGLLEISYQLDTTASYACDGGPGLRFVSDIAHGFSGKKPPPCDAPRKLNPSPGR